MGHPSLFFKELVMKCTMYALFPIKKIENYVRAITFENYLENESPENVIQMHGINCCFLDKSMLRVHPNDILITMDNWKEIEDINFKELFVRDKEVFVIEFEVNYTDILFPLTRAFNSRFELLAIEWLSNYVTTLCDEDIYQQSRVSLNRFMELQQIPEDDRFNAFKLLAKKYVFATDSIMGAQIKSIQRIKNPLL